LAILGTEQDQHAQEIQQLADPSVENSVDNQEEIQS
jgi:hypothetical protein